jgi:MFS family permease
MLFPSTATSDARRLVVGRALRGFADGLVSVLLASHLFAIGLSAAQVGAVVTATLHGSAALTLAVGLGGRRLPERSVLLVASVLMFATGLAFAGVSAFPLLLLVAFVGTLNPSGGDVSVFLPTEQSLLAANVGAADRTALFARYNLAGTLLGALGALATGIPLLIAPEGSPQPRPFLHVVGQVMEWIADVVTHKEPAATVEAALHARDSRYASIDKARRELGYEPRPARAVLADAVRFFASEGYCRADVADRILRRPELDAALREATA